MGNRLSYIAIKLPPEELAGVLGVAVEPAKFSELVISDGSWITQLADSDWSVFMVPNVDPPEAIADRAKETSMDHDVVVYRAYDNVDFEELVYRREGAIDWSVARSSGPVNLRGNVPARFSELVRNYEKRLRFNRRTREWVDNSRALELTEKMWGKPDSYAYLAIGRMAEETSGFATNRIYSDDEIAHAFRVLNETPGA